MKKFLVVLGALIAVAAIAIILAFASFDIDKYRGEIEAALGKEIGRSVKLGGAIHIGLSSEGLALSVKDVAFGNPAWASRPRMASISLFNIKVGLWSLLEHRIEIGGFTIENADILLESDKDNRHNWDMQIAEKKDAAPAGNKEKTSPVTINITSLSIRNSRIGLRNGDGSLTVFKADEVTLGGEGSGIGLHFAGSLNGLPIKLALLTSADSLMSKNERPVSVDLLFADYHLVALAKVDFNGQKADISQYELASGDSVISGRATAFWSGARPVVKGAVASEHFAPADFKLCAATETTPSADTHSSTKASSRMFSDAPLDLAALRAADVGLDIALASMPVGSVELQNVKGKLIVSNGHMQLSPLTMQLGAGTITGQVNFDAGVLPARFGGTISINGVDLSDLIKLWGAEAFLSGKIKADINLASSGNSLHDLASNLNGPITMIGAGGDVVSSAAGELSSMLSSGTGNSSMNCIVARLIAQNGIVRGNGILIDTMAATAAGYGDIDLRSETLNMVFRAKPKIIDIGGLLPPLHIGGTLSNPSVRADPGAVMQNVGQFLTSGSFDSGVPDVLTQQGQNACAYALDHPEAPARGEKSGIVPDLVGKANNLLKGLLKQ